MGWAVYSFGDWGEVIGVLVNSCIIDADLGGSRPSCVVVEMANRFRIPWPDCVASSVAIAGHRRWSSRTNRWWLWMLWMTWWMMWYSSYWLVAHHDFRLVRQHCCTLVIDDYCDRNGRPCGRRASDSRVCRHCGANRKVTHSTLVNLGLVLFVHTKWIQTNVQNGNGRRNNRTKVGSESERKGKRKIHNVDVMKFKLKINFTENVI